MRKGNTYRLPPPPTVKGTPESAPDDVKALQTHIATITDVLNQSLQTMQTRIDTVQQIGAKKPPTVTGLTVTGKQGLFHLTWNRQDNVDGYVVVQGTDSTMQQITNRYHVSDGDAAQLQIPVGNVAVAANFQVYAHQGPMYSDPTTAAGGTTLMYTTSESAPPAPPIAPRPPKLAPVRSGPNLP